MSSSLPTPSVRGGEEEKNPLTLAGSSRVSSSAEGSVETSEGLVESPQPSHTSTGAHTLLLWYLCVYGEPQQNLKEKDLKQRNSPVLDPFFHEKERLDRGMRFLAARSLVAPQGALARGHPLRLLKGLFQLLSFQPSQSFTKALSQATHEYQTTRQEVFLRDLSWNQLAQIERSGEVHTLPRLLAEQEGKKVERYLQAQPHLGEFAVSAVKHHAIDLLLRVSWRRYGPVVLLVLGTLSAFTVSGVIWFSNAESGIFDLMRAWWSFLFSG